jgi:hypothetical protein
MVLPGNDLVEEVEALAAAAGDIEAIETLTYEHTLGQIQAMPEEQRAALGDIEQYARAVAEQTAQEYSTGWFVSFLNYDPAPDCAQTMAPVLAIFGGKEANIAACPMSSPPIFSRR